MTKWPGIPKQCEIQMNDLNEFMRELQDGDDGTLLLNVNPWSAAQLFNIYNPYQKRDSRP